MKSRELCNHAPGTWFGPASTSKALCYLNHEIQTEANECRERKEPIPYRFAHRLRVVVFDDGTLDPNVIEAELQKVRNYYLGTIGSNVIEVELKKVRSLGAIGGAEECHRGGAEEGEKCTA
jgi:hypothetical protein